MVKKAVVVIPLLFLVAFMAAFRQPKNSAAAEALGKKLFFDPILSEDRSISCASCHKPEFAFADTVAFSTGVYGQKTLRNTPSAMNVASRDALFWDGRAATLEEQALGPIANPLEMNLPVAEAVQRIKNNAEYRMLFRQAFGKDPDAFTLAAAISAFERSLETSDTPNDRWLNDEPNGLSEAQVRGRTVFREKGKCFECHFSPDFTRDEFRSIGLFNGDDLNDSGRYAITKKREDIGKMKVPGLRNVAVTAPYMHNGHFKTLREVIDYYDDPSATLPNALNRDSLLLQPLGLTEGEKQDLEAFLHALTDDRFLN